MSFFILYKCYKLDSGYASYSSYKKTIFYWQWFYMTFEDCQAQDFERSGKLNWPLPWQLTHAVDLTFDSSPKLIPNSESSLINPTPLHFVHAITLRLPHFLHIPREVNRRSYEHNKKLDCNTYNWSNICISTVLWSVP